MGAKYVWFRHPRTGKSVPVRAFATGVQKIYRKWGWIEVRDDEQKPNE